MKPGKFKDDGIDGHWVDNHGHMEWHNDWPTDPNPPRKVEPFKAVELRRRKDGWTAERQGLFLNTLAQTGSVAHAAQAADITPRSAYRLRNHPQGETFARAMDAAMLTAARRLLGVAMERAITGTPRTIWRGGRIVAQTSVPSDRMLMFLLRHLSPALFGRDGDAATRTRHIGEMQAAFPAAMAELVDLDIDADLLDIDDYREHPPMREQA